MEDKDVRNPFVARIMLENEKSKAKLYYKENPGSLIPLFEKELPMNMPHKTDWTARFLAETCSIASFVVITGFTINLIPRRKVINTEKLPMVAEGTRLDT